MNMLMAAVGVIVFLSGLFFYAISHSCDNGGKFKTPWWSGKEATYICVKEQG